MNSIELDIKKSTIFIPKETAEAIGYAKEMSILYRESEDSLFLVLGLPEYIINSRKGQRLRLKDFPFERCLDEKNNGYRLKISRPMMNRLTWYFPGSNIGNSRGTYILDGEFTTKGCIRYDLLKMRQFYLLEADDLTSDLGDYEIVPRSMFARKPRTTVAAETTANNHQTRYAEKRN